MRNSFKKFDRYTQPAKCGGCGRNCLKEGGTDLCRQCYDRAGIENEHADGHHAEAKHADCPACKGG